MPVTLPWLSTVRQPLDHRPARLVRVVSAAVDIGAFESSGFTLAIVAGNNQSTPADTAFPTALQSA